MADEEKTENATGDGAGPEESGGGGKKKLILFIVLPLLVIGGGATGAYFSGLLDPLLGIAAGGEEGGEDGEQAPPVRAVFYELPEFTVSLQSTGRQVSYLKLKLSLEIAKQEDVATVEGVVPRIVDDFHFFLSELRKDDLKGSEGMYRIREELLIRANAAVAPVKVQNVLVNQMLLQ